MELFRGFFRPHKRVAAATTAEYTPPEFAVQHDTVSSLDECDMLWVTDSEWNKTQFFFRILNPYTGLLNKLHSGSTVLVAGDGLHQSMSTHISSVNPDLDVHIIDPTLGIQAEQLNGYDVLLGHKHGGVSSATYLRKTNYDRVRTLQPDIAKEFQRRRLADATAKGFQVHTNMAPPLYMPDASCSLVLDSFGPIQGIQRSQVAYYLSEIQRILDVDGRAFVFPLYNSREFSEADVLLNK